MRRSGVGPLAKLIVCGWQCTDLVQDEGLRKVGACCSKLRRLVVFPHADGFVTHDGLTAVAEGCFFLEKIIFYTADMTSTALETVANNCSNPSDIRICLEKKPQYQVSTPLPFDFKYSVCTLLSSAMSDLTVPFQSSPFWNE